MRKEGSYKRDVMPGVLLMLMLLVGIALPGRAQQETDLKIDTTDLSKRIILYRADAMRPRPLYDPYAINLPKLQPYKVRPEAIRLNDVYNPVFNVSTLPYNYGEYKVGGVIRQFGREALIGSGSQTNMIGLGISNTATLGYMHAFNRRLTGSLSLTTVKFSAPHLFNQSIGVAGDMRYRLSDRITLNTFGNYDYNLNMRMTMIHLGGSAEFDLMDHFGIEAGAQTFYDNWNRHWQTMPIVRPYYKISDDFKIGFDVGPIIQESIRNAIIKNRYDKVPAIKPPKMGGR